MDNQGEQDALDQLYAAVRRLREHGCDKYYLLQETELAYELVQKQEHEAHHGT